MISRFFDTAVFCCEQYSIYFLHNFSVFKQRLIKWKFLFSKNWSAKYFSIITKMNIPKWINVSFDQPKGLHIFIIYLICFETKWCNLHIWGSSLSSYSWFVSRPITSKTNLVKEKTLFSGPFCEDRNCRSLDYLLDIWLNWNYQMKSVLTIGFEYLTIFIHGM